MEARRRKARSRRRRRYWVVVLALDEAAFVHDSSIIQPLSLSEFTITTLSHQQPYIGVVERHQCDSAMRDCRRSKHAISDLCPHVGESSIAGLGTSASSMIISKAT